MTGDSHTVEAEAGADAGAGEGTSPSPRLLQGRAGEALGRPTPVGAHRQTLAPETLRLYAADWVRFAEYCASVGARALPALPVTVAAFLAAPGPGRAARTRRLAAIDHRHRQHGLPCPGDDPGVRAALRAARRAAVRRPRPPPPSPTALRHMALRCPRDLTGLRDRALLLLLALGLSRRDIVGFQTERLRWEEDGVRDAGGSLWLPRLPRHDLCPARALEDWLRASATRYGPVFRKVTRWGTVEPKPLGADAIGRILARRAG
ncbi:MAG: hypothetical protein JOZ05_03745 [Acetobacteraceae bacterium]|nr:hypothetical protein [Acetobacteraceae bacterium]